MSTKKKIVITAVCIILLVLAAYGMFQVTKLRTFQFFGGLTHRVETSQKVVALTFDDAPMGRSNEVVDLLNDYDVKATFYLIGENIEKNPAGAEYILANGHELGNHSYTHKRMVLKSNSFIAQEVEKTNDLIRSLGYEDEITFRPPYGKKLFGLPWYLNQHDIKTIMWDVESDTYASETNTIVDYTLEHVQPGSIILLHPFCDSCIESYEALPLVIDALREDGYEFVTVSELLQYD